MLFALRPARYLSILFLLSSVANLFAQDDLPQLPETTVVGEPNAAGPDVSSPNTGDRPGPFPANDVGDNTVLSANRTETPANQVGSAVTVITREQIEATRQTTVLEVLRSTPGVQVVQQGGPGRLSSIFIRGANSAHTKVYIDGIPISNPAAPNRAFNFADLTTDNIERIEVLRGPQSAQYGSDAIGGVINITTRRGKGPPSARATFMGGHFGTHQERVGVSGGNDNFYYSVTGGYYFTDGISVVSPRFGATEADSYQNITSSGRFGFKLSDQVNVDYIYRYTDGLAEIDGFLVDQIGRTNQTRQFYHRVQLQSFSFDGELEQKVGFSEVDYDVIDNMPGFFEEPIFKGNGRTIDYQANLTLTEWNIFSVGFDYLDETAFSPRLTTVTQENTGVYLQDRFNIGERFYATASVRWDDHNVAGSANTYRFTSAYNIEETGTRFHGSLATAFRAPSLSESFFIGGVVFPATPNPDLRPEQSKGWDAGVEQSFWNGALTVDATVFDNRFEDLIVADFSMFPTITPVNVDRARTTGLELFARAPLTQTTEVDLHYTFTDAVDVTTGVQLLRRPRQRGGFTLHQSFWNDVARAHAQFLYVGKRTDFDALGNVIFLDDYITVNLSGSVQATQNIELFGRIDNLFGENYEEVFGFNTPGFSIFAGANIRL